MPQTRQLRGGDLVRVRTAEEILATLDEKGRADGLPFMPEMLQFAGREMRVYKRADKTCDTIHMTGTTRKLDRTVHLLGARCDGSAHGGCQAGCLMFFREDWLERPNGDQVSPTNESEVTGATLAQLTADTRAGVADDGAPLYRCQATELLRASRSLSAYDPRQYVADVRTRNAPVQTVLKGFLVALFNKCQRLSRRLPARLRFREGAYYPFYRGTGPTRTPDDRLNLEAGELVEIKNKEEIMATLREDNRNRGLWFDPEMLPYCGSRARVNRRIEKIIDEPTGRMIRLRDCIALEGVVCRALYHRFCPRAIEPYWREAWLRRVTEPDAHDKPSEPISLQHPR